MWRNLAASRLPAGEDRETAVKGRDVLTDLMTPEFTIQSFYAVPAAAQGPRLTILLSDRQKVVTRTQ